MADAVGTIYGQASSTRFDVALRDPEMRRLDYIRVDHSGHDVLGQIVEVVRRSDVSFEDALVGSTGSGEDRLSATIDIVGYMDDQGRVQAPRTPFKAGAEVFRADDDLVIEILGLQGRGDGANVGAVKGTDIPVRLSMNVLAQKHVSVLAKTGAGKSYTVGVLLEEFLTAGVPLVILDPHGEYGSLRHANVDQQEISLMPRFGVRPRSFDDVIKEWTPDTMINPDGEKLRLEGMNLEGREIVDLLGGKLSGGQVGVLYQAVKEVKEDLPAYTLQDVMDAVGRNKSSAKWNVLNALEALDATGVFHIRGTPVKELVKPKQCTIINMKGVPPDVQDIIVTRLTGMLWEARKRDEVPPHIVVVEEAHNFCPERGVGNAISGGVIRTVASEGRKFGLGLIIVSQRPAKIDKNVLSQCNTQFVLKVTNPNDVKAVVASVEGITSGTADEIQRLPVGSALIAGGGLTQPVFCDVRPRITRHGGRSVDMVKTRKQARKERPRDDPSPARPAERKQAPAPEPPRPATPPAPPRPDAAQKQVGENSRAEDVPTKIVAKKADSGPGGRPQAQPEPDRQAKPHTRPPTTPPTWTNKDLPHIHRVAARTGIIREDASPDGAVAMIRRIAEQNGRQPDARVGLYAEIGRQVCAPTNPACIRCPLADQCEHHGRLQEERQKTRSVIRRLWTR